MRLFMMVNETPQLLPSQTSALLLLAAPSLGVEAHLFSVSDWTLEGEALCVSAHSLQAGEAFASPQEGVQAVISRPRQRLELQAGDILLLRTNPARDPHRRPLHDAALDFARLARHRGVATINDPDALARFRSKLSLPLLPTALLPKTFISQDADAIIRWLEALGERAVLKPLEGTRGQGVFLIEPGQTANLRAIIDVVRGGSYALAQSYVPGADQGDARLVLLDGALLEIDGHPAAIRRVPQRGDFRSNLHSGAEAQPCPISPSLRELCRAAGAALLAQGLRLVGLDVIGETIIEANVFSTGGLRDAQRFADRDFSAAIVQRFLDAPELPRG